MIVSILIGILTTSITSTMDMTTILKASQTNPRRDWVIVNDTVMGGRSWSKMETGEDSSLVFKGSVSLENNGGFASTRLRPGDLDLSGYNGMAVRIRGDGNTYQLRLRTDDGYDGIAYRAEFKTEKSKWTTVRIPFSEFLPSFRGRIIADAPPLEPGKIRQIGFLIASKQSGEFRLEIESILAYRAADD